MLWVYNLSLWQFGILCCATFVGIGIVGYFLTKPLVRWLMGPPPGHNEGVDVIVGAVTLLYGLILALIAVGVWEQFTRADDAIGQEAAVLRSLYRDVETYPEPARTDLTHQLREYTKYVIEGEWPAGQKGHVSPTGSDMVTSFEKSLYQFEPPTERSQLVDASAISEFNKMVELRTARLHTVNAGIPGSIWAIILIGSIVTIFITYFLQLDRVRAQLTMTSFVTLLIGLVIFMTVEVDHPFRGVVSVTPEAFQTTYDLMTKQAP